MPTNGSAKPTLIDTTPQDCELSARSDLPPLVVRVWPDYRGAPDPASALTSVLVLMLVQQSHIVEHLANRIAALEIHTAEQSRGTVPEPGGRARDDQRSELALIAIRSAADGIEINARAPASAFDQITLE